MPMIPNPFIYGDPVNPANFFNRRQAIRRVVGRLLSSGQSTALIGEPRTGKTSLLHYLGEPDEVLRQTLYGDQAGRLLFSYLDSDTLGAHFTAAQFWERAVLPLDWLIKEDPDKPLAVQYRLCQKNGFGPFTLEALFRLLKNENRRLVVLLDEFEALLNHPILNSAEFFGGLRSLASRSESLALVVGSSRSLAHLNADTQAIKPFGSPFFNFFTEITLGPFPKDDVTLLLNRAGERFTVWDTPFQGSNSTNLVAGEITIATTYSRYCSKKYCM